MEKTNRGQMPAGSGTRATTAAFKAPTGMLRDVVITCADGTEPPAAWRDVWLEAGWTIEARIDELSTSFLLDAPVNGSATTTRNGGDDGWTVERLDTGSADLTGLVPRSAFLSHLSAVIRRPEQGCRALMAIRIDQATDVAAHVDRTRLFDLEDQVSARLAALLDDSDLSTIWLELGFGILVQRDGSAHVWDLATRLCACIADEPFMVAGAPLAITASIGLSLSPHGPLPVDGQAWFASSYAAQGIAHRHGGNRPEGLLTREFEPMLAERVLIVREWANEAKTGGNVLIEYRALMPMKPTSPLLYYVHAKLRDLRAPLRGVYRTEYLRLARAAGAMVMIDRMSLFQAFQTLDLEYAQGRETRLIVPVEPDTLRGVPWRWLEAEVRRRPHVAGGLVIELEAQHELQLPDIDASLRKLRAHGVHVCLSEESTDLVDVMVWAGMPPDFLRIPASIPQGMSTAQFNAALSAWRVREKRLIVDGVSDAKAINLAGIHMDYVGGDAIAVVSPRLEHEFAVRA